MMRILIVIPHYFGPSQPEYASLGSYTDRLSRIAAFTETIVALHRHFGSNWRTVEGRRVEGALNNGHHYDVRIVVLTLPNANILNELKLAPGTIEVRCVECEPAWIPMQVPKVLAANLGAFDFYCYLEDDLAIHDPLFFSKLLWFQKTFGLTSLLAPVRFEMSSSETLAKVIVDPELPDRYLPPFRRPGQAQAIVGTWEGIRQEFQLPKNPHAASFFLTQEQMAHWVKHPTFDDQDASWVGPIESVATLSIGKVFDIYKPSNPDPFFLELQHFGCRYARRSAPNDENYGDVPLLTIAQDGERALLDERKKHEQLRSKFENQSRTIKGSAS